MTIKQIKWSSRRNRKINCYWYLYSNWFDIYFIESYYVICDWSNNRNRLIGHVIIIWASILCFDKLNHKRSWKCGRCYYIEVFNRLVIVRKLNLFRIERNGCCWSLRSYQQIFSRFLYLNTISWRSSCLNLRIARYVNIIKSVRKFWTFNIITYSLGYNIV